MKNYASVKQSILNSEKSFVSLKCRKWFTVRASYTLDVESSIRVEGILYLDFDVSLVNQVPLRNSFSCLTFDLFSSVIFSEILSRGLSYPYTEKLDDGCF